MKRTIVKIISTLLLACILFSVTSCDRQKVKTDYVSEEINAVTVELESLKNEGYAVKYTKSVLNDIPYVVDSIEISIAYTDPVFYDGDSVYKTATMLIFETNADARAYCSKMKSRRNERIFDDVWEILKAQTMQTISMFTFRLDEAYEYAEDLHYERIDLAEYIHTNNCKRDGNVVWFGDKTVISEFTK